ncbi:hypothetical protein SLA2020_506200 [Shorea laevis]
MKLAPRVVFLFRDSEGFGSAIADALHPSPSNFSTFLSLNLALDYLIQVNFRFHSEQPCELPLDRYGIRDQMIRGLIVNFIDNGIHHVPETSSSMITIIAPFFVPSSKLRLESRSFMRNGSNVPLYSVQVGPEADTSRAVATKTDKVPLSLQIHYEPLACLLRLVNVLKLPTSILIAQRSQSFSDKALSEDLEMIKNPWRALYG